MLSGPVGAAPTSGPLTSLSPNQDVTWMTNGQVAAMVRIGNLIYLGGNFTTVREKAGSTPISQAYLAAFDANTGAFVSTFRPTLDGRVFELLKSPDGSRLYVGGGFNSVNGKTRKRIAALSPTGTLQSFQATINGPVRAMAISGNMLYVGGGFTLVNSVTRDRIAALNATNGALETGFLPP